MGAAHQQRLPPQPFAALLLHQFVEPAAEAAAQLVGGGVGEGDDKQAVGIDAARRDMLDGAGHQHGCFAAAGSGADNDLAAEGVDGLFLCRSPIEGHSASSCSNRVTASLLASRWGFLPRQRAA